MKTKIKIARLVKKIGELEKEVQKLRREEAIEEGLPFFEEAESMVDFELENPPEGHAEEVYDVVKRGVVS